VHGNGPSASRNTVNDDVAWITAEPGYVFLYPLKKEALIEKTGIEISILPDFFACEEAP
jgi:hypothetical protein